MAMARPVRVDPVKERARIFICSDNACPEICPWPESTLITPGGNPHFSTHCDTFHGYVSVSECPRDFEGRTCRQRCFLARFHDNTITCCQRRCDLLCEEYQWSVPRDDDSYDSKWLPQAHVQEPRGVQASVALRVRCFSEVVVLRDCIVDIDTVRTDRFPHSDGIKPSKFIFLGDVHLSQLLERGTALLRGKSTPCWEGSLSSINGIVHIINGRFGNWSLLSVKGY